MPLKLTEKQVKNIVENIESIRDCLDNGFNQLKDDKITSDFNFVKASIEDLTPLGISVTERPILKMLILDVYREIYDSSQISEEVYAYFVALSLDIINTIDYQEVYNSKKLQNLFNNFLVCHFSSSNELQVNKLYESFIDFKNRNLFKSSLTYFQLHLINQLFTNEMFAKISDLLERYDLVSFEKIEDKNLVSGKVQQYFYQLSYTLLIHKKYENAFELTAISLNLKSLLYDTCLCRNLIIQFVFISMMLRKYDRNTYITILKFRDHTTRQLLKILKSYQIYDLPTFVLNYVAFIENFNPRDEPLILRYFNKESLKDLCAILVENKLSVFENHVDDKDLNEYLLSINDLIKKTNNELSVHHIILPFCQYHQPPKQVYTNLTLAKDTQRLLYANACLKELNGDI